MPGIDPLFQCDRGLQCGRGRSGGGGREIGKRDEGRGSGKSPRGLLDPHDLRPGRRRALSDWLQLQAALCLRPVEALEALRRSFDPAEALARIGVEPPLSAQAVGRVIRALARHAVRALPITSPLYPLRLRTLPDPPPLLLLMGDVALLGRRSVALVGARAATAYGLAVARDLASQLAEAGLVVVSGLARGVDGAAHRGALAAGGLTLAVQACGPDRVYPPEHASLRATIADRGAVLAELPLGHPPRAAFFPLRNRLISGLAEVVVVVEARERSGSLITARHALDQGRDVMVVPGGLFSPTSRGTNRLLRDGAQPVLEASDVLDMMEIERTPTRGANHSAAPTGSLPAPAADAVEPEQRLILEKLCNEPLSRDELARELGRPPERLAASLLALELAGCLSEDRDGRLHPTPGRGRGL